jgi:hypothetical protein
MNKVLISLISSVLILSGCVKSSPDFSLPPDENILSTSENNTDLSANAIAPGTIIAAEYQPGTADSYLKLSISYANFSGGGSTLKANSFLPSVPLTVTLNENGQLKTIDLNDKQVVDGLINLIKLLRPLNENQLIIKNKFIDQLANLSKRKNSIRK